MILNSIISYTWQNENGELDECIAYIYDIDRKKGFKALDIMVNKIPALTTSIINEQMNQVSNVSFLSNFKSKHDEYSEIFKHDLQKIIKKVKENRPEKFA